MPPVAVVAPASTRFACLAGCGFCCATSPGLDPGEQPAGGTVESLLVSRADGSRGIRLNTAGSACAALDSAHACTAYGERPRMCRAFPVHVHAGERLQATVNLACPGLFASHRVPGVPTVPVDQIAADALEAAHAGAGDEAIAVAQGNWREFRRRLQVLEEPDPTLTRKEMDGVVGGLVDPHALAAFYLVLADGHVRGDRLKEALADALRVGERPIIARDILPELARESFTAEEAGMPLFVVPVADGPAQWWGFVADDVAIAATPITVAGKGAADILVPYTDLDPFALPAETMRVLGDHLHFILQRDHTLGHAARVMDATGYEVTYAAALGRVMADAAAGLMLRACLLCALDPDASPVALGENAVRFFDLHFLSQPSVGAVF